MRLMLASRSSLEKPRPLLRFVRTSSPSSTSILTPRARSCGTSAFVSVVLPAPDSPVNHNVNPRVTSFFLFCYHQVATAPGIVSLEAAAGIEPTYKGFADLRLTTWLRRLKLRIADCNAWPQSHGDTEQKRGFLDNIFFSPSLCLCGSVAKHCNPQSSHAAALNPRSPSIRTCATSGRVNSTGGVSPRESISRTRVPLRLTWCDWSWGQVLSDAIPSHLRQKKVLSKNIGAIFNSPGPKWPKMSCESYVP